MRWLILSAVVCAAACAGGDKGTGDRGPEICGDGVDNDLDGFADCSDSDCFADCIEDCTNGVDDDDDGLVDCFDPACFGGLCAEICDDGGDNDLDGDIDCLDTDCSQICPETCDDGFDNDGDGRVDCDDDDCASTCDADGDGAVAVELGGDDCDDADPDNFPDNPEICDGVDNNCNLLVDDADPDVTATTTWYVDADQDGFGGSPLSRCEQPVDTVTQSGDCDDGDGAVNPAATEACNGFDDNCDGLIDDDDPALDLGTLITWYPDGDGDGWGVPGPTIAQCAAPPNHADNDTDCNDNDPAIPGAEPWLPDTDGDGYGAGTPTAPSCTQPLPDHARESAGTDCDDGDPFAFPGAPEQCEDGIDQDCDGLDPLCVLDLAVSLERATDAVVDLVAGTYDGTETLTFTGNASGLVYCEYTYVTQDWANSPTGAGADPIGIACADPDGVGCAWNFTLTIDQGLTTGGDPTNCDFYGRVPTADYSPSGYGWTDSYNTGGVNLGAFWMYYDPISTSWLGIINGSYDAVTGDFAFAVITDTGSVPPP